VNYSLLSDDQAKYHQRQSKMKAQEKSNDNQKSPPIKPKELSYEKIKEYERYGRKLHSGAIFSSLKGVLVFLRLFR
jgi:hypothetical protein